MKHKEKKNTKKILLIILLLLLLLIPFSCTVFGTRYENGNHSSGNIKKEIDSLDDYDDEIEDDFMFVDEESLEEEIFNPDVEELDFKDNYRYSYTNYNNNTNSKNHYNSNESNLNIKDLVASISYSTNSLTYKTVVATITSNKELEEVKGWTLSEDKKTLTKEYSSNTEENVTIKDKDGITKNICISIKNISSQDKEKIGTDGEFKYIVLDSGEIQLTRYIGSKTDLTIPANYDGYKVYAVGNPYAVGATSPTQAYNIFGDNSTTNTTITKLTIEDGITVIEEGAFNGCSKITGNLIIPNSVTSLRNFVFANCTGLNGTLTLSSHLNAIEKGAFYNCSNLKGNLILPNTLKIIGRMSFGSCSGFTGDLIIPEGVEIIDVGAFQLCSGFNGKLTLPSTLESIGDFAFTNCSKLTGNLNIPEGVKSIGTAAFNSCSGFNGKLTLPSTLESIGDFAFNQCSKLTGNLNIPEGVKSIGAAAFQLCSGFNGELSLPNSLKEIRQYAFNKCSGFTGDLSIPEGVKIIGKGAFQLCSGFNGHLILLDGLIEIQESAFVSANFTGVLNLPSTLESIGDFAFHQCRRLSGDLSIPEGVKSIGKAAFNECTGLTGILSLPSTLESIGSYAFNHCEYMKNTSLTIPKSVKIIGDSETEGTHVFYNFASTHITEFIVEEGNEYFKAVDGVLFTKDGTRLIQYPTSKPGNTYEIPEGVTILDPLSFSRAGAASAWCSAADGGLRTIIIPDSLNLSRNGYHQLNDAIYTYAGVTHIEAKETNPNYKSIDGILYSKDGKILYAVPVARKGIINIEEGVTRLPGIFGYASSRYSQIINIPKTVTYISSTELSNLKTMGPTRVIFEEGCIYQFDESGNVVKTS